MAANKFSYLHCIFYSERTISPLVNTKNVFNILGRFLQVYAALIFIPVILSFYYSEPVDVAYIFLISSSIALILGTLLQKYGERTELSIKDGLVATVLGWVMACLFGGMPFLLYMSPVDAFFEASAGLTTTGMSIVGNPQIFHESVLFWRGFMQWIGGLGILTFFIAIVRESGGISRKLFTVESHKTDPGSVRPSLFKSIVSLWKVYALLTLGMMVIYYLLDATPLEAVVHGFTVISTGGFSTFADSIAGFNSLGIEAVTILFMLIGGTNFVLIYALMKGNPKGFMKNTEFKVYRNLFALISILFILEFMRSGFEGIELIVTSLFHAASFLTSAGYTTESILAFSAFLQFFLIGVMFVGGSLGSTSGGFKIFRVKVLYELVKTRMRSYSLPETAINEVKIDREIVDNQAIRTISVIFFLWISVIFLATSAIMLLEDVSLMGALSGTVSASSNMGPVFMEAEQYHQFNPISKIIWSFTMLAGRLEMIPLLAIFNRNVIQKGN